MAVPGPNFGLSSDFKYFFAKCGDPNKRSDFPESAGPRRTSGPEFPIGTPHMEFFSIESDFAYGPGYPVKPIGNPHMSDLFV